MIDFSWLNFLIHFIELSGGIPFFFAPCIAKYRIILKKDLFYILKVFGGMNTKQFALDFASRTILSGTPGRSYFIRILIHLKTSDSERCQRVRRQLAHQILSIRRIGYTESFHWRGW